VGLNGPPCAPDEIRPLAGVTERLPAGRFGFTKRLTGLVWVPLLFVVFVKVTVSLCHPAARLVAVLLINAVTIVLAPDASVPLVDDSVTHGWVTPAVQMIDVGPGFWSV
jgi:hypothetical protein